jgi:hypothetical protein
LFYLNGQLFAHLWVENLLGVVKTAQHLITWQKHSARYHRAGEGRHSCFVNAGDEREALFPEVNFKPQECVKPLTFGAIAAIALADSPGELVRPGTRINLQSFKQSLRHWPAPFKK